MNLLNKLSANFSKTLDDIQILLKFTRVRGMDIQLSIC